MPDSRYSRVKALFVEAAGREGEDRMEFLARECADDEALRREVERLLAADAAREGFLASHEGEDESHDHPERIDDYRVTGIVGIGGTAIVYRAEQKRPRREVAIKVLRAGIVSRTVLQRFEREASALGRLKHPAIAQIHGAGTWETEAGPQPYLVMELVEGQSLTRHARQLELSPRKRVALVARLCRAVHYAHENGIVHRDLKPSNVLVTGSGDPKVLDFGLARFTEADVNMTTLQTDAGQLLGTVPYMSPEQITGDVQAIGPRSDVYSLGVVLYELLADELPLDLSSRSIPEATRAILDEDPLLLGRVHRAFRGDLETIVATALEKDPDHRYGSAAALADDLERFLGDRPIVARPASTVYQLAKFARRNRGLVAGLVVAMGVLVAAVVVSTTLAFRANRDRASAELESRKLQAVNSLFVEMFEAVDPEVSRRGLSMATDVRVVDVLDEAMRRLATTYADQPEVELELRKRLSRAYQVLADWGQAWAQLDRALDLARGLHGEDGRETLALAIQRVTLSTPGRSEREAEFRALLGRCERVLGPDDEHTIACLNGLTGSAFNLQRMDDAVPLAEEAARRAARSLPAANDVRLTALNNLAFVAIHQKDLHRAEALFDEVLQLRRRHHGEEHPATIRAMSNIVNVWHDQGRIDESIEMMQRVLDLQVQIFGEASGDARFTVNQLAVLLARRGDLDGAIEMLERIVAQPDSGAASLVRLNLARFYCKRGNFVEAEAIASSLVNYQVERFGDESFAAALAREILALAYTGQERHEEALLLFEQALETLVRVRGDDGDATNRIRLAYAKSLIATRRFENAERILLGAYESAVRVDGPDHVKARNRIDLLISLNEVWERPAEVARWRERRGADAD